MTARMVNISLPKMSYVCSLSAGSEAWVGRKNRRDRPLLHSQNYAAVAYLWGDVREVAAESRPRDSGFHF